MTDDFTRPVALPESECNALRYQWLEITEDWLTHASDSEVARWSETFYPAPLADKRLSAVRERPSNVLDQTRDESLR